MLDRYWFGDVERISPEAPVPVVRIARTDERPGGAANVARNAASLGAQVALIGIIGDDEPGRSLERLLRESRVAPSLHRDASLPTTVKLRVIGRQQQLLRSRLRDRANARGARRQACRLRARASRHERRRALRLRQGRSGAHRAHDRAGEGRRCAGAGRSQGRGLRALPRRDHAHSQSRRIPPGRGIVAHRGGARRKGADRARAARTRRAAHHARRGGNVALHRLPARSTFRRRRARCSTSRARATR